MNIGQRIQNKRKELKMSADELANKLGKDRSTIYRYEKGDIENLPLDILEPIAKALNTSPAYLMGWEKDGTLTVQGFEKDLVISYRNADEVDKTIVRRTLKLDTIRPKQKNA